MISMILGETILKGDVVKKGDKFTFGILQYSTHDRSVCTYTFPLEKPFIWPEFETYEEAYSAMRSQLVRARSLAIP